MPPDVLYFKNTEFTKKCKIQSKCYVSNTVAIIKKLQPELEWFENHPQFCHIFHMPDEPYLKLAGCVDASIADHSLKKGRWHSLVCG